MTTSASLTMFPPSAGTCAPLSTTDSPALMAALRSAEEVVAAQGMRRLQSPSDSGGSDGESLTGLLAVLTCCYANGVFGSWQVVEFLEDHPFLRELSGNRQPEVQDLREFRREHRSLLQAGLARLLAYMHPVPEDAWSGFGAAPAGQGLPANANWQAWLAHEAESRIRSALQMDTLSLDE